MPASSGLFIPRHTADFCRNTQFQAAPKIIHACILCVLKCILWICKIRIMDFKSCSAELDFAPSATKLCVLRRISRNPRRVCMSRSSAEGRNLVMPSSMDVSLTMRKTFLKVCACRGSAYRRRCGPRNAEGDTEGFLEVCRTSQANLVGQSSESLYDNF